MFSFSTDKKKYKCFCFQHNTCHDVRDVYLFMSNFSVIAAFCEGCACMLAGYVRVGGFAFLGNSEIFGCYYCYGCMIVVIAGACSVIIIVVAIIIVTLIVAVGCGCNFIIVTVVVEFSLRLSLSVQQ